MVQEFSLDLAKAGVPVVTRDGRKARIICFDRVDEKTAAHLVVLVLGRGKVYEQCLSYDNFGHTQGSHDPNLDLMVDVTGLI